MLQHSIRLLVHYLRFWDVPIPYRFLLIQQRQNRQQGNIFGQIRFIHSLFGIAVENLEGYQGLS